MALSEISCNARTTSKARPVLPFLKGEAKCGDKWHQSLFWDILLERPWATNSSPLLRYLEEQKKTSCIGPIAKSHTSHLISLPVYDPFEVESITRIRLDSTLQAYFYRMHTLSMAACHPREIHTLALSLSTTVGPIPGVIDAGSMSVGDLAKKLLVAGIAEVEYSRSVAILVGNVMDELLWRSTQAKKDLDANMVEFVTNMCESSWTNNDIGSLHTPKGIEPLPSNLENTRAQILNISVFLGDLCCLGAFPTFATRRLISFLAERTSSIIQARALYLALLRATSSDIQITGDGKEAHTCLGASYFTELRRTIVRKAKTEEWAKSNEMAQRWLIEICNVIDGVLFRLGRSKDEEGTMLYQRVVWSPRWNRALQIERLRELVYSQKPSDNFDTSEGLLEGIHD